MVNYPPSLNDPSVDHKVIYTLQGFFDLPGSSQNPNSPSFQIEYTAPIPICFLPLIPCLTTREPAGCETWRSASGEPLIEITGELGRPACCPGDVCTVKLSVINKSDYKISALHVSLIVNMDLHAYVPSTTSTFVNGDQLVTIPTSKSTSALPIKHRTSTLYSETSHVAIPRNTQTPHNVTLRFQVPTTVLPTVILDVGRSFNIHYNVVITIPLGSANASAFWSFSSTTPSPSSSSSNLPATVSTPPPSKHNTLTLTLPLTIATIPSNHPTSFEPVPSFLENPQLPTFIKNDPMSDSAPSSPISPISPWAETPSEELPAPGGDSVEHNPFDVQMVPADDDELDPDLRNQSLHRQDAAGYLLPPQKVRHSQHHKRSAGDAAGVVTTGTMEVPALVVGGEPETVVVG
ncbi:hypothetical protein BC937DRAFT_86776 [Endogone sp. FLAS-F59071]|nr:hypothetical protein BC937DRAFT_86776 [Endogone sp. FLAS-F59071]|eukprot:RUS12887.1 hypothetical protein BC937DRAFT_86776 [Endogone sp. FLAS-F59071]